MGGASVQFLESVFEETDVGIVHHEPLAALREAQKALLAVLRSPSRQQKGLESERQANLEFQVFVHAAGSATRVLWVSQHTQRLLMSAVLWVERTLELRETVGGSRPPLHDEWTCARCRTAGVQAIAERATKGTVLLRPSPTAKEGSSTGCPELSWRRRCRARAAEHVQSYWA